MKYILSRTYHTTGTTSEMTVGGYNICHTIELPWADNHHQTSCIPEGEYELVKHHSEHLGDVIMLKDVPGRDMVYMHPANDASKELLGCIAPVYTLSGDDSGVTSKPCFNAIRAHVYAAIDAGEKVMLTIQKAPVV